MLKFKKRKKSIVFDDDPLKSNDLGVTSNKNLNTKTDTFLDEKYLSDQKLLDDLINPSDDLSDEISHSSIKDDIERMIHDDLLIPKTNFFEIENQVENDFVFDPEQHVKHVIKPEQNDVGKVILPKIYILTRTSNRENFFFENWKSVQQQKYPYICQLVSYDNEKTYQYLKKYEDLYNLDYSDDPDWHPHQLKTFNVINTFKHSGSFPYNMYLNHMLDHIIENETPGWILFLDDDDLLVDPNSIMSMVINLKKQGVKPDSDFLMWQVEFPNGRLVPKNIGRRPRLGDVSMIGFMFHSLWAPRVRFEPRKGGDYLMIKKLNTFLNPKWVEEVLTKINYEKIRRIGSGKQNDQKWNAGQIKEYKKFWENKMTKEKKSISLTKKKSKVIKNDNLSSLTLDQNSEEIPKITQTYFFGSQIYFFAKK